MRDSPGTRTFSRPRRALTGLLITTSVAGGSVALPWDAGQARAAGRSQPAFSAKGPRHGLKALSLTLKSRVRKRLKRAAVDGSVLPLTIRLRRSYEGGPGDDVVALSWDTAATPWPLAGTAPSPVQALTHLDGAATYQWDFAADTTGYTTAGTVETNLGGGVSMTGTGFPIGVPEGAGCTTLASLDATGMSLTSAGARFGTLNPFSGDVSGTLNLRTAIRTRAVACGGDPATAPTAVAATTAGDPPLPVAFSGRFTVSPALTADGRVRVGLLRIVDATDTPQRSTYGLIQACTDPLAADQCGRRAFPVRTKMVSMTAEVLMGDAMPAAPGDPPVPVAPAAAPAAATAAPASSSAPASTSTPALLSPGVQPGL
jgi:hypothetical protein